MRASFDRDGHLGPVPVLTPRESRHLLRSLRRGDAPAVWSKGHAVATRAFYAAANHPTIVQYVTDLLGADVMLWGAELVTRRPGQIHRWHCDAESYLTEGRTITVWLGLDNTTPNSGLQLIPGSHNYGRSVQQFAHAHPTADEDTAQVVGWARTCDQEADVVVPEVRNGDALIFDGRLWHGSHNVNRTGTRSAVILQYAAAATPVHIPASFDWPFAAREDARPPCLMITGVADTEANAVATPPAPRDRTDAAIPPPWTELLPTPLAVPDDTDWAMHHVFNGPTECAANLEVHASVLRSGATPHPPHQHRDEEVLLVLDGEVALVLPDEDGTEREVRGTRGTFAYYPATQPHTIRNVGIDPAQYLMFKWWSGPRSPTRSPETPDLPTSVVDLDGLLGDMHRDTGFTTRRAFEGPTHYLHHLEAHASTLTPGASYKAHVDPYDVALVVLEGSIETETGQHVGRDGIVFCPRGYAHGLRNPGAEMARYLAIEFHGPVNPRPHVSAARRAVRRVLPRSIKHALKKVLPIS